jgi:hypothetical protein
MNPVRRTESAGRGQRRSAVAPAPWCGASAW